MKKKDYQTPRVKTSFIDVSSVLAGSTGATGEDVPWAVREAANWDSETEEFEWGNSKSVWGE